MKKILNKVLYAFLACGMILSMTGCNANDSSAQSEPSDSGLSFKAGTYVGSRRVSWNY